MELQVVKVEKNNDNELVVIKVIEDCNLWPFILFDSTFEDGELSNLDRHSYMFPNQEVKLGDFVLLYSHDGQDNHYSNRAGSTTWEFYWGLEIKVWNTDKDAVILVKAEEVKRYPL